jgi:SOS-response transcriptional repressor LexA
MYSRKLTKKQEEAYLVIAALIRKNGYPPSQREIAEALGTHLSPAQKLINKLYVKGYIKKDASARGIELCYGQA